MTYVQKTRLEEVAAAIQELRWAEMRSLAKYISAVEINGEETPDDWAAILNDWSFDMMVEYAARCEGKS